ncbi:hypothetical protein O3P69_007923 [Scylla paramamosain]|uniref:Uncharacterized protein n=1 Tax=Scylla paramamosain TaxID=85552 RepID=A0AAW0SYW0_SCYPA
MKRIRSLTVLDPAIRHRNEGSRPLRALILPGTDVCGRIPCYLPAVSFPELPRLLILHLALRFICEASRWTAWPLASSGKGHNTSISVMRGVPRMTVPVHLPSDTV